MWDQEWKCSELKMKKLTKKLTPIYSEDPTDLDSPSTDVTAKNLELKDLEQKFERVMETSTLMYKNQPKVPGYPGFAYLRSTSKIWTVRFYRIQFLSDC
jgi:hypothetical protein